MCDEDTATAREIKADLDRWEHEFEELLRQQDSVLEVVSTMVDQVFYDALIEIIEDSGHTYNYKITDKAVIGEEQTDDYPWGPYFVQQETGFLEDSYMGTISIPLNKEQFFEFSFSM